MRVFLQLTFNHGTYTGLIKIEWLKDIRKEIVDEETENAGNLNRQ
jgi:hypothetical protein